MIQNGFFAPAKLNLFLHIVGRRADGYHNLQTLFQFIDYSDILHFDLREDGQITCQSTAENISPEQDLCLKAAHLLKQVSGTRWGVDIQVEKNLPIGGGLGGGSSDAATTLLALNQLWHLAWTTGKLRQLGVQLGADVPFFVQGQAAWAEGIGEKLTPVTLEEPWFLVIRPHCAVSTAKIFSDSALTRKAFPTTISEFFAGKTRNVCEPVVCAHYPQVANALNWLNKYSAARMTGTGACIFARFDSQTEAQTVLTQLNQQPEIGEGFIAQGKNISPAFRQLRITNYELQKN